jgi:FlaA1/EpsC-like NDP-sugar epimerase
MNFFKKSEEKMNQKIKKFYKNKTILITGASMGKIIK